MQLKCVLSSTMDQTRLLRRLAQAEERVVQGERYLKRQRDVVVDQEFDGRDATKARALLVKFEEQQSMRVAERDWIKTEISEIQD